MTRVVFGAVALFVVGCAGSQPGIVFRSAEVASKPAAASAPSARAIPPRAVHGMVATPVSSPAPAPAAKAAAEPANAAQPVDAATVECADILDHIIRSRQLLAARIDGASDAAQGRAALTYLDELAVLDEQHPTLHHALRLRVVTLSTRATRTKEVMTDPASSDEESLRATGTVKDAIDEIGSYCGPLVFVEGEAS